MTNFEAYKSRILELGTINIGVDTKGRMYNCWDMKCFECLFSSPDCACGERVVEFLYAPHKE